MISLSSLPSADLLQQFQGVERGLRTNRRVNHVAWVALLIAVFGAASVFTGVLPFEGDGAKLVLVLLAVLAAGAVLLLARTKYWVKESKSPLRYTCSVADFLPLGHVAQTDFAELAVWMGYDLSQRLNERLRRLAFLEKIPEPTGDDDGTSHIHISGQYLIRSKARQSWELQITPRVRVGGAGAADTLGHPVKFTIPRPEARAATGDPPPEPPAAHVEPPIDEGDYDKLIERVYFSAATQIYKQLRADVAHKIGLLPRGFLRATAYLYEADDYAQSNTLAAYDEAAGLYRTAVDLYDPSLRPKDDALPRWRQHSLSRWRAQRLRQAGAERFQGRPRRAKRQVYAARAETGLATVLLYRRTLAGMSGHRVNPIYEARPVVERAIERLRRLPDATKGRSDALFRAHVAKALAAYQLESMAEAEHALEEARCLCPSDFERDAAYLYAAGMIEPHGRSALPLLRQAVANEPRFEVAQFELAYRDEMAWRRTPSLENAVAEIVLAEYEQVLKLNPGNVRAWGNMGYIRWLLDRGEDARRLYDRGREYKDLNPGIQVASLDFGLARIEAEQGHFENAYTWYRSAVTAQVAMGASDSRYTSAQYYAFDFVGDSILSRFELYRERVEKAWAAKQADLRDGPYERVNKAVLSYMYNDLGEACHTYSIRNNSTQLLERAEWCYRRAIELNPIAVLPNYNLYLLYTNRGDTTRALEPLERVRELEPTWPDAIVAWVAAYSERAGDDVVKTHPGKAEPETIVANAAKVTENMVTERLVRNLLPHEWLWNKDADATEPFDWSSLANRRYHDALRWERELNDLHVRVLFNWGAARLLTESGKGVAGAAAPTRGRAAAPTNGHARELLDHIRGCYWPGNFRVLLTARYVDPKDQEAEQGLRDLLRRWLAADPTAHWALKVMMTPYYDVDGNRIPLIPPEEAQGHLRRARQQSPEDSDLAGWIQDQLGALEVVGGAGSSWGDS
jgi:tetratricopeptide (TPR) repeat protein